MKNLVKKNSDELEKLELEEFDEKDIVNRDEGIDIFEAFSKQDVVNKNYSGNKANPEDAIFSHDDISEMVGQDLNAALTYGHLFEEEEQESSLIKSEDIASGKTRVTLHDFSNIEKPQDLIIKETTIPEIEIEDTEDSLFDLDDEDEIEEITEDQIKTPEEEIEEYLLNNFKDFIVAPHISGIKHKGGTNNFIPLENIKAEGKTVEIADKHITSASGIHQSTVMINRTEDGEVESIEVICKCGERTLIKFDYIDTFKDNNLTDIVDDQIKTVDFNDLPQNKEEIELLNPDLVFKSFDLEEKESFEDYAGIIDSDEEDYDDDFFDDEFGDEAQD